MVEGCKKSRFFAPLRPAALIRWRLSGCGHWRQSMHTAQCVNC